MQTTGNLGLKKPDGTDIVDIADLNGNMDVLDTAVKNVQDHAVDTVKHITAAERTAWNAKASTAAATASAAGLMAAADKAKLDGVAAGANKYVHPNHTGDVTSTGDGVTAIAPGVIVNADINAAAAIDATKIGTGVVSNAEFGYLDGVTSGIQGQLNNKAPLATTPQQTTADITYYVRTDGNDANNGLANTAGGAFRTINRALNAIPRTVNHNASIFVSTGTYSEAVIVQGFSGTGTVALTGAATATNTHNVTDGITSARNTCRVHISGFRSTTTTTHAFYVINTNETFFQYCTADVGTSQFAVYVESAKVYCANCIITGRSNIAVYAHLNGEIFMQDCSGSANSIGHQASYGGRIHISGTFIGSTSKKKTSEGGLVTDGPGVANPWGDNTTQYRTAVAGALATAGQAVSTGVFTKINYGIEYIDYLGEWNQSTATFVPQQSGQYQLSAVISIPGMPGGYWAQVSVFKDGTEDQCIARNMNSNMNDLIVSGSITTDLVAGHSYHFGVYHNALASVNLSTDGHYCHFRIVRVS